MLTKTQVKVILLLLNNSGYAEWRLAKYLEMEESNLNPILKDLERKGIIYQGEARASGKQQQRKGDYKEFPYYLIEKIDNLRTMIREIAESKKFNEKWFILSIVIKSEYIQSMIKKFKEDVYKNVEDELLKSYPPYTDSFITDIINPPTLFLESGTNPETSPIEFWYKYHLRYLAKKRYLEGTDD